MPDCHPNYSLRRKSRERPPQTFGRNEERYRRQSHNDKKARKMQRLAKIYPLQRSSSSTPKSMSDKQGSGSAIRYHEDI